MSEVIAWIAVDRKSKKFIFDGGPERVHSLWVTEGECWFVEVPKGTAEKLTGKPMTWADEPRELR